MRLLVLEDDPTVMRIICETLRGAGYDVEQAGTIAEALSRPGPFDGLVLDLVVPDGNGRQVAEAMPAIPRVIVSGADITADVPKPFRRSFLLETVARMIGAPPARVEQRVGPEDRRGEAP